MRLGIIGAENSHTAAIAKTLNVDKKIKGFTVEYVWGETDEFARNAAKAGQIPNIVKNPREMLGKIDAVLVDHRHPKYHLPAILPFLKKSIPVFVDKPFCYRASEGKKALDIAKENKTPVTSFSVIPHQKSFRAFMGKVSKAGKILSASSYGPCDLQSPYGGIFFYGIHQVEAVLKAFGYDVKSVLLSRNGHNATGQLFYRDGLMVTMNFVKENCPGFHISAIGEKGPVNQPLVFDKETYFTGIKIFTTMFRTGREPETYEHILKPVQVLEALEKSVKSGNIEEVEK